MKRFVRESLRKLLAITIALTMSIPPNLVLAAQDKGSTYTEDSSIMGLIDINKLDNKEKPGLENNITNIRTKEAKDYYVESSAKILDSESLTYTITLNKKKPEAYNPSSEQADISLSLLLNPNSHINNLSLIKVTRDDKDLVKDSDYKVKEADFDGKDLASFIINTKDANKLSFEIKAHVDQVKENRTYQLAFGFLKNNEDLLLLNHKTKVALEKVAEADSLSEKLTLRDDEEESLLKGTYISEGILGGLFANRDSILWTDYLTNDTDEELTKTYSFNLDDKEDSSQSTIGLDYYAQSPAGFVPKREFSQNIPFGQNISVSIPKHTILKISLKTKVDKKNTSIKNYSLNNREVENPLYKEGNDKKEEKEEPKENLPKVNKENKGQGTSANPKNEKKENEKANPQVVPELNLESKKEDKSQKPADEISAISLNKDAYLQKLQKENKTNFVQSLNDIENEAKKYDEGVIDYQIFLNSIKTIALRDKLDKENLKEILEALILGLNKEKYKLASVNVDEIINNTYEQVKANPKDDKAKESSKESSSNFEKADDLVKNALDNPKTKLDGLQSLLDMIGKDLKLTREEENKLMTKYDGKIKALVKKDGEENIRPNLLLGQDRQASNSFDNKVFNLKTVMKVKASPVWAIPTGWYFDVNLGPYLKTETKNIKDLKVGNKVIAKGQYFENGNNHYIRYTYIRRVTEELSLNIDQDLSFDMRNVGSRYSVDIDIKVAPKNNPVQTMPRKTVSKNDPTPVTTEFVVEDKGEQPAGTYPYELKWRTTSQKLKDNKGHVIQDPTRSSLAGAYVEWDIEVDTDTLLDKENNKLDFKKLNITVFASSRQGLWDLRARASKNKADLESVNGYEISSRLGEVLSLNTSVKKADLGEKLYIKVKAPIDTEKPHETYSIGLRINPDSNYIKKMVEDAKKKFESIPSIFKWIKGLEEASRFSEVPFNLVEAKIPARVGLRNNYTNERFYYDRTRTIVADRITDNRADWYALDLIRLGEKEDPALDKPTFTLNNSFNGVSLEPTKYYYVPLQDGGYRRTSQVGDVILENGQYYPGTLVSYEYRNQTGTREDSYYFKADINERKKDNFDPSFAAESEGGHVDLFTEKISESDLRTNYLMYTENPYPVMRINKNFDMVHCFNSGLPDPAHKGKKGIFLDIHENPTGDYLISRLNENINSSNKDANKNHKLTNLLNNIGTYDGVSLNPGGKKSQGAAMEDLMKRIFYYAEEVKREYKGNGGKQMHRLIESGMIQKVIHHYTDGNNIYDEYFTTPLNYNDESWKHNHTLSGKRQPYPKTGWDGQFKGKDHSRVLPNGLRKLKDDEELIGDYPPVKNMTTDQARKLLDKVVNSYRSNSSWTDDMAKSVKLVFYSHTNEGKYQELITGRVIDPIEIEKVKEDGTRLKDATFTLTNIYTGEKTTFKSTDNGENKKLYLQPGTYRVRETAPDGYEQIKDFNISVERKEINPDNGSYDFKELPEIHVNDGFKTVITLDEKNLPKSGKGDKLVTLDDKNLKIKVTNVQDDLGKLEFTKKNKFTKLLGTKFSLRKISANSVEDAEAQLNAPTYDPAYNQESEGTYGEFKFEQIPEGFYILEETVVPEGYEKAPKYIVQAKKEKQADDKNKVNLYFVGKDKPKNEDGKTVIINKTKKTNIKFRKVREEYVPDTAHEHLGLGDAKFRLMSLRLVDGDFYIKEGYTDRTKPSSRKVDGQDATGGGYITFEGLKAGEYLLEELEAPKGYAKTELYGWKLVVSQIKEGINKGELEYKLYKVPEEKNLWDTDLKEVHLDTLISGDKTVEAFQIGNEARKISIPFDKYLSSGKEGEKPTKVSNKVLLDENDQPVEFNLYKADYYGAIIDNTPINKHPIVQNIKKVGTDNPRVFEKSEYDYSFELQDLEFGGYYVLKEKNPPKGYKTASSILLKVEAEAIANEGLMKVIVRDPNPNAMTNEHSMFYGVIDFEKTAKLGEFSIRKIGNAIGFNDENGNPIKVGLRRAYFRLYTADENYDIIYKDKGKKYAKEYIQKVTPGDPITEDNGKGGQKGKDPEKLPPYQGIVTFDQLKPGNYVLEEYRGPAGYEKDSGKWYIHVDKFGVVKKYRDKPGTPGSREAIYSNESPRFRMAGLNISEPLRFNRLMQAPSDPRLGEIQAYDTDTENATITVSAGAVDTSNGSRDIKVKITPKTKKIGKNRSHWVLLIDRSQDFSGKNNLDNNINKFITDLRAKADTEGAEVYLSIIEYSGNNNNYNKVLLAKTNIKNLDNARQYSYKMLSLKPRQFENQFDLTEENVTVKDYLSKVRIDRRNGGIVDGGDKLKNVVAQNLSSLTSDDYDNKYVINFANFNSNEAKKPGMWSESFEQFEAMWGFKQKGYKRVYTHVDQTNTEFTPKGNEFKTYVSNNSEFNSVDRTQKYILINKGNRKAREFGPYVQKDLLDSILNNDSNFTSQGKEESLLTNARLNIKTDNNVDINSYTISKNGREVENSNNPTKSIDKNISLGVGESLELTYKIGLDSNASFNDDYFIHRSMTYQAKPNDPSVNLDTKLMISKKIKEAPKTYKVNTLPTSGGRILVNPSGPFEKGSLVTISFVPDSGKKLDKAFVDGWEVNPINNSLELTIQDSDITVSATFVDENVPPKPGKLVDLKADFIYANQTEGKFDKTAPSGFAGTIQLYAKEANASMPDSWIPVGPSQNAPFKGNLLFTNLNPSLKYMFKYTRDESNASLWGTETTSIIDVDLSNPKKRENQNDLKIMTISNGNLMEIFNKDESGFRIPLRITKVNENKGALTGSQFKARKILNGDRSLWRDIPNSEGKPSGKYKKSDNVADKDPIYFDEKYDGVSEATGEPGDNYFRELTPGLYELTEVRAPDGTYRKPVDDEGKPMKWYFQVFVYEGRNPRGADYMGINFYFKHTFTENDSFNKDNVTEAEKQKLLGTTIEGLGSDNTKFNKYIKVIPDDGRSNPARPDAPYQGINDAQVTNYKNRTTFSFLKKDKETYQNLALAEFSLRKAKTNKDGSVYFDMNGKAMYEPEAKTDSNGKNLTAEQLTERRIKPFDDKKGYAIAKSDEKLGVEFTNIEEGTYILEEDKPKDGFAPLDAYFLVTFKEDDKGAWKQEVKAYKLGKDKKYHEVKDNIDIKALFEKSDAGKLVSVYNEKNYIDFNFKKINAKANEKGEEVPINTAAFKITQVNENHKKLKGGYEKEITHYGTNGFEFKNLGVGHYKLQETWAIEKFEKSDPWYFEVVQDPKTYKLKIVFEKEYKSIRYTIDTIGGEKLTPKLDDNGNPADIRVANFEKIDVSFKKTDQDGKALKDALFTMKKVRKSMDDPTKIYEYYDSGKLKKYTNYSRITEYDESGLVRKFTHDKKIYEYDDKGDLIRVNGQAPTEEDKKVRPDGITSATGKFNQTVRSQSDGEVSFQKLSEGIYELEEVSIPEGYKSDSKQFRWILKVEKDKDGLHLKYDKGFEDSYYQKYENDPKDPNSYYKKYTANNFKTNSNFIELKGDKEFSHQIKNTKTTTNLKWKKITNYEKSRLITKDVSFSLIKVSDNPDDMELIEREKIGNVAPYDVSSDTGIFEIKDLTKGLYLLSETQAPEGYEPMDRKIVIKIREVNGKLEKQLFELKQADGVTTSYLGTNTFNYLLTRKGRSELDTDKDGTFYINNKERPYVFPLSKGFIDRSKGYPTFYTIKKGKLTFKIYADPADSTNTDTKVYYRTIDLNENDKSYEIHVDGIKLNKVYILEEVEAPDGYVKTKNKYKLRFNWISEYQTFVATLLAVIGEDGKPLKNEEGRNITEMGTYIGGGVNIGTLHGLSNFKIINNKTEIEFKKVGKDEKGEKPLNGVKFYLEKQDPKDIGNENQGYYPLTAKMQFIKSELGRDGNIHYYYEEVGEDGKIHKIFADDGFQPVTLERNIGIYKSDEYGKFKISNLTDGYYRVIEPEAPEYEPGKKYMQVQGPVKKFRVVEGKVYMDYKDENDKIVETELTNENKDKVAKIVNEKSGLGKFKVKKYDDAGNPMAKVTFEVKTTDADEKTLKTGITNQDGEIEFKDLAYGYYWLVETKTVDGYIVDTKKKLISLGGDKVWNLPSKNDEISNAVLFDGAQADLQSTSGDRYTVYPNKEEAIVARFKLKFADKTEVKPGNYFTIKFNDLVDLDGIVKDKYGRGNSDSSNLDIIGPAGVLAKAEIGRDRRSITYTFTDYVANYKPINMNILLQVYPDRYKVTHKQDINVIADIGDGTRTSADKHFSKSINIDYRGSGGYQDPNKDISSYMLRLDPMGKTFTAIIYYNPWNRYLKGKNIEFLLDKDVDPNSLEVTTYKKMDDKLEKRGSGSHPDGWTEGDLPDSYGIDPVKDKLVKVGTNKIYARKYLNLFDKNGWYDSISIPSAYLNYGEWIDGQTQNKDQMSTTYVVEIKGKLTGTDIKSLKTKAQYYHVFTEEKSNAYYSWWEDKYDASAFDSWSKFFEPKAEGDSKKEVELINFKNRIDFVKVNGGVKSKVVDTRKEAEDENKSKVEDLEIGEVLSGAVFELRQNGVSLGKTYERTSDDDGKFSWTGLGPGTYEVWEKTAKEGYKLPEDKVAVFTVDEKGNITIEAKYREIVENYKNPKIRIKKVDQDGKPIAGGENGKSADFTLSGKMKGWNSPSQPTGKDGIAEFKDLPFGDFELKESKAPATYNKTDQVWKITVTKDGRIVWTNSFDDAVDIMKDITVSNLSGERSANLDTKLVGIDKDKQVFRQYNLIKAKVDDLKTKKISITSPDSSIRLNQTNTRVRLVGLEENSSLDSIKPIKDESKAGYKVEYGENSMEVSILVPDKQEAHKPVGSSGDKTLTYLLITDIPYAEKTRVGAKITYMGESVDKYVANDSSISLKRNDQSLEAFKDLYRPRLINDLDFVVENIKKPEINFKKVDASDDKALEGAEFELKVRNKDKYKRIMEEGTWKATTKADGKFKFENIPDGDYLVEETKAPDGYSIINREAYKFRVEKGEIYKEARLTASTDQALPTSRAFARKLDDNLLEFVLELNADNKNWNLNSSDNTMIKLGLDGVDIQGSDPIQYQACLIKEGESKPYKITTIELTNKTGSLGLLATIGEVLGDTSISSFDQRDKLVFKAKLKAKAGEDLLMTASMNKGNKESKEIFAFGKADNLGYKNNADNPVKITNSKSELPKAGSTSTWMGLSLLGLGLMLVGILIYHKKKMEALR